MKKFINNNWSYALIFLVFFIIGIFTPTGGDDWEISQWYNPGGLFSLLCRSIYYWTVYNGRILNNFFDMFLGRYDILWSITSSMIYTLTIYFLLKTFKLERKKMFQFFLLVLFLCISSNLRMELQLHKTCNISYTIPAFSIFLTIYLANKFYDKEQKQQYFIFFFLGLFCSLWIENLTISLFATSVISIIYDFFKNKKINYYWLMVIIGCSLGMLILFSSPGFLNRYNSSVGESSIVGLLRTNGVVLLKSITINERLVFIIFSLTSFISLIKFKRGIYNKLLKIYFLILSLILMWDLLLSEFSKYFSNINNLYIKFSSLFIDGTNIISILLMLSMLFSIFLVIIKLFSYEKKKKLLELYFLSFISIAPMILTPGYRNNILCIYSLLIIIVNIISTLKIEEKKCVNFILVAFTILFLFRLENYNYVLKNAYEVTKIRKIQIINYKVNQINDYNYNGTLLLPKYDKEIFQNLNSDYYKGSIINYYKLNKNSKIVFID